MDTSNHPFSYMTRRNFIRAGAVFAVLTAAKTIDAIGLFDYIGYMVSQLFKSEKNNGRVIYEKNQGAEKNVYVVGILDPANVPSTNNPHIMGFAIDSQMDAYKLINSLAGDKPALFIPSGWGPGRESAEPLEVHGAGKLPEARLRALLSGYTLTDIITSERPSWMTVGSEGNQWNHLYRHGDTKESDRERLLRLRAASLTVNAFKYDIPKSGMKDCFMTVDASLLAYVLPFIRDGVMEVELGGLKNVRMPDHNYGIKILITETVTDAYLKNLGIIESKKDYPGL